MSDANDQIQEEHYLNQLYGWRAEEQASEIDFKLNKEKKMNIEEEAKQNIQTMKNQVADFCKTMGFDFHIVHENGDVETLNGKDKNE